MMDKLPKSEAWKQSDPDRPGLLLHPSYPSRDSVGIHRISTELPHSSKLELRNPIGPRRISAELPPSSYNEDFRKVGRPYGPQSLASLLTRLRLSTTLRMRDFQVESLKCGMCVDLQR
jgi:hypothetical protein